MVPGRETLHLSSLLTSADHRGSDVVPANGVIVNGSMQIAPYPGLGLVLRPKLQVESPPTIKCAGAHRSPKFFAPSNDFRLLVQSTIFPHFRQPSGGLCLR